MEIRGLKKLLPYPEYIIDSVSLSEDLVHVQMHRDRRRRLRCPDCKASSVFHPEGIDRYSQSTQRLKNYVSQLCQYMPASHVPEFVGISHETARRYDKEVLEGKVGEPDLENLRYILIDEKAIGKHHKYVTVVLNAENGELLFMQRSKKKETLEAFYSMIPEEKQAIKLKDLLAFNKNLNTAYVLKEAFHHLYDYVYPANAAKYLRRWCDWAFESGLSPLVSFAKGLLRDSQNIISYFRHQITNGPIEAFNSIIGRIIYQACGIKDLDYLFLKLRQKSTR